MLLDAQISVPLDANAILAPFFRSEGPKLTSKDQSVKVKKRINKPKLINPPLVRYVKL